MRARSINQTKLNKHLERLIPLVHVGNGQRRGFSAVYVRIVNNGFVKVEICMGEIHFGLLVALNLRNEMCSIKFPNCRACRIASLPNCEPLLDGEPKGSFPVGPL